MKASKLIVSTILLFLIIALANFRFPFSSGDRYFNRLQRWYSYAQNDDWIRADNLAANLDPADIKDFQSQHHPNFLRPQVQSLSHKSEKTVEDYLELAKIYLLLGQKDLSREALQSAQRLDPIRGDIGNFIVDLKR